jgi:hypothetical protein
MSEGEIGGCSEDEASEAAALLILLLFRPNLDKLELTLVSPPVDLQLLSSPVPDGTRAELLLREAYVSDLLGTFVEFNSRHFFLGVFRGS